MQIWFRWLLLSLLIILSGSNQAAENNFLTGMEVTNNSARYYYVGTSLPLPGSNLGKGYVLHLWADYQTYSYDAAATNIIVNVNSLSAAIGYHDSGEDYWWNARLGVLRFDSRLKPNDPGNDSAGTDTNMKFQIEGENRLSDDFKLNGNFEYIFGRSAYWMRGRFMSKNDDSSYDGPELIYQGDPNYSAWQIGWVLNEMTFSESWNWGVKAGFRLDENEASAYVGIELSTLY